MSSSSNTTKLEQLSLSPPSNEQLIHELFTTGKRETTKEKQDRRDERRKQLAREQKYPFVNYAN